MRTDNTAMSLNPQQNTIGTVLDAAVQARTIIGAVYNAPPRPVPAQLPSPAPSGYRS
jgi:hypothetical protein